MNTKKLLLLWGVLLVAVPASGAQVILSGSTMSGMTVSNLTLSGTVTAVSLVGSGELRVTNAATGNLVTISNGSVTVSGGQFNGNGAGVTNLNLATYSGATNSWTADTAFPVAPPLVQTNYILASGEATLGIPSIGNVPTATTYYGELTVYASGTITFTNVASVRASDFLKTRTITNGNTADIAIKVVPGRSTNMAILQYK